MVANVFITGIGLSEILVIGYWVNPILERGSTVLLQLLLLCHAQATPLDSEMGWTGELWSKTKFLILEN